MMMLRSMGRATQVVNQTKTQQETAHSYLVKLTIGRCDQGPRNPQRWCSAYPKVVLVGCTYEPWNRSVKCYWNLETEKAVQKISPYSNSDFRKRDTACRKASCGGGGVGGNGGKIPQRPLPVLSSRCRSLTEPNPQPGFFKENPFG